MKKLFVLAAVAAFFPNAAMAADGCADPIVYLVDGQGGNPNGNPGQGQTGISTTTGCPAGLLFQGAATSLDLNDIAPEGADRFGPEGDSDTIGGAFTYWGTTDQKGQRYDLHYQHARRVFSGSRARLVIDLPINLSHADAFKPFKGAIPSGGTAIVGTVNVGLELPVEPNWVITPRVSYGVAAANAYFGGDFEQVSASVSSRYKISAGRGDLIIGNMVSYAHSVKIVTKQFRYDKEQNWVFRNGLAYQLPLKSRMFGRQASIRASYVFTNTAGDRLAYEQIHEVGISIGVRSREAEQKSRFEQLRIGLLYTHSNNRTYSKWGYDSGTLTLGYRF